MSGFLVFKQRTMGHAYSWLVSVKVERRAVGAFNCDLIAAYRIGHNLRQNSFGILQSRSSHDFPPRDDSQVVRLLIQSSISGSHQPTVRDDSWRGDGKEFVLMAA